MFKQVLTWTL